MKCTEGDKTMQVSDETSVKVPGKSADIVVVVEQNKYNEPVYKEFVQPLITQVSAELAAKGIS